MRYLVAILSAVVLGVGIFLAHWSIQARFAQMLKERGIENTGAGAQSVVPARWLPILATDQMLCRVGPVLVFLVMAVGLALAWLTARPREKKGDPHADQD